MSVKPILFPEFNGYGITRTLYSELAQATFKTKINKSVYLFYSNNGLDSKNEIVSFENFSKRSPPSSFFQFSKRKLTNILKAPLISIKILSRVSVIAVFS